MRVSTLFTIENHTCIASVTGIKLRNLSPISFHKRISEMLLLNILPVKYRVNGGRIKSQKNRKKSS